jgi:hypothetical protein
LAWNTGVLPRKRPAVDRLVAEHRREDDHELAVRRSLVAPEDRERAVEAPAIEACIDGRVVVVGPDAGRVGTGLQPVRERLPGRTLPPGPEKPGM